MEKESIFSYIDYKQWLQAYLDMEGHGSITRLAKVINCQRSYLSQVITANVHLTPDQAYKLGNATLTTPHEKKYLSLMIEFSRAGNRDYREHLKNEMTNLIKEFTRLEKVVGREKELQETSASFYYSAWYWSALHICTSLKGNHTANQIADSLKLDIELVLNSLNELVKYGLVEKDGSYYKFKAGSLHLTKESPLLPNFHQMWRNKVITNFTEKNNRDPLHLTVVQSISKEDFKIFSDELRELIRRFTTMAEPSPAEVVVNFNIDFSKITT